MFETARPFLLSLALGLLIGTERERAAAAKDAEPALGVRTFTLLSLLGTMAAHVDSTALAAVLAAFAGALVVVGYVKDSGSGKSLGATTEVAAVATFTLGYLAHAELALTAMLGVIVVAVLALKPRLHEFAREELTPKEVSAALAFLVIAFVVLPLLPDRPVDPWGVVNPFRLWLLFVLIAGIGFGGYIAIRSLGPGRGLALAGLFAGLVSSTAATLTFARRARTEPDLSIPYATAIVLANVASAAAQVLVVALANPAMVRDAAIVVGAPVGVGLAATAVAAAISRRRGGAPPSYAPFAEMRSPLDLREAGKFAAGLAVFLGVASVGTKAFGAAGALGAAAIGGLADVHAVTLGVSTLASAGDLVARDAILAILVAFLSNMAVKLAIAAWAGGRRLAAAAAPPMVAMALAAGAAYLWLAAGSR